MSVRVFRALPDEGGRNTVPTVTGTRVQRLRAIREALLTSMGGIGPPAPLVGEWVDGGAADAPQR